MFSDVLCNVRPTTLGTAPSTSVNVLKSPILLERLFGDVTPESCVIDDLINFNTYQTPLKKSPKHIEELGQPHVVNGYAESDDEIDIRGLFESSNVSEASCEIEHVGEACVDKTRVKRPEISPADSPLPSLKRCSLADRVSGLVAYRTDGNRIIVGLPSQLTLRVELNRREALNPEFDIVASNKEELEVYGFDMKKGIGYSCTATVDIFPHRTGESSLRLINKGDDEQLLGVTVEGNNPLVSLSAEPDWPVAVTARPGTIFIAFPHHIDEFTEFGENTREFMRDELFYNDIVVHPVLPLLAAGVSAWEEQEKQKYRSQLLVLYNLMGEALWTVGGELFSFKVPVIHPTFDSEGNVLVSSQGLIAICSRNTGKRFYQRELTPFGIASRLTTTQDGGVLVLDGTYSRLHVLHKNLDVRTTIDLPKKSGGGDAESMCECWVGMAVDKTGLVYLSNITNNSVVVYTLDGRHIGFIESEWGSFLWPLSMAISGNDYLYVVDHGHACVKKFNCYPIHDSRHKVKAKDRIDPR